MKQSLLTQDTPTSSASNKKTWLSILSVSSIAVVSAVACTATVQQIFLKNTISLSQNAPTLVQESKYCKSLSNQFGEMSVEECGIMTLQTAACKDGNGHFVTQLSSGACKCCTSSDATKDTADSWDWNLYQQTNETSTDAYAQSTGYCRRVGGGADAGLSTSLPALTSATQCKEQCSSLGDECVAAEFGDDGCHLWQLDPSSEYVGDGNGNKNTLCFVKSEETNAPTLVQESHYCTALSNQLGEMSIEECGILTMQTPACEDGNGHFVTQLSSGACKCCTSSDATENTADSFDWNLYQQTTGAPTEDEGPPTEEEGPPNEDESTI